MGDIGIKIGGYYRLDPSKPYFSIDLQRKVRLDGVVAVKATHYSCIGEDTVWFGSLVDTDGLCDYDTANEIEFFAGDVTFGYLFRDKVPLLPPMVVVFK